MLKNLIFDFGGVIYRYNPDDITRAFFPNEADRKQVKPILYRKWQALDEGAIDYSEYAKQTVELIPAHLQDAARRFFRDWLHVLPPRPEIWSLIGEMKARGLQIYLLSNAPTYFAEHLDDFPILRVMDGCVVSGPIRMFKPNEDIFRHTLEKYSLNAGESLFIDDNPQNARTAEKCGLHGFAYAGNIDELRETIESLLH